MELEYRHYMKLSRPRLIAVLNKRKLPPLLFEHILSTVERQRNERRAEKLRIKMHKTLWGYLLKPLQRELKLVRAAQFYESGDGGQRHAALAAYETALLRARTDINKQAEKALTPKRAAEELKIPNGGLHWVDWVPEETQIRVSRLFAAIPHKNKAKHKTPFDKGQGAEGTAHWLRVKIAQDTARAGRLLQKAEIYERAGSTEPAERKKAEALQQSIALMTKQLRELEHGNRSKKQRDTKKQTSLQDEGSSAAGEKHSQRGCVDDDEREGTGEDHGLPDSAE